ncbi:MAG: methionine adenosyltransferase [Candidatus Calescibacterium sp.]|nr:methionine adenosyltransferase [Candidatus Calescibacterium sp.]MDW8087174.1 methionine adenosyltransferase [Candidatus Calescibacterium sp.]
MGRLFSSESVTEGHPDKLCDKISDAVLDEFLRQDKYSRVACESLASGNMVVVTGEITSDGKVDFDSIVRRVIRDIGYEDQKNSIDWRTADIKVYIKQQSEDIARGVIQEGEIGAGDQGTMFGYAVDETPELMPMTISFAHKIVKELTNARKSGKAPFLRPDGKSQVTIEYENGKPKRVHTVVVSTQHAEDANMKDLREFVIEEIVKKIIPNEFLVNTKYFINPTGRFVIGGPLGDAGLTGRKVIVDTYGGHARHGGGAFSGKDPTKVDRSANYMARRIAKTIVASKIAKKCEVCLTYVIGVADPVHLTIDTFGTSKVPDGKIEKVATEIFKLKPKDIIEFLDLRKPIYEKTAAYGHFGRENEGFKWEELNPAEIEIFASLKPKYKRKGV